MTVKYVVKEYNRSGFDEPFTEDGIVSAVYPEQDYDKALAWFARRVEEAAESPNLTFFITEIR